MTAVIDYDAGNMKSVEHALLYMGEEAVITRDADTILAADKVILPGVGAFDESMERLKAYKLADTLCQAADRGIPLLGICLGLQLLFEHSEEGMGANGLGILKGDIRRIPYTGLKIPHMGWNSLTVSSGSVLYRGIEGQPYVYFVHSFYLKAKDASIVSATTEYGTLIHASVEKDNVFACQFHPEKSG